VSVCLAAILYSLGKHETAVQEINQALDIRRKKLPPGHGHIRNAERRRDIILAKLQSGRSQPLPDHPTTSESIT
jgi:hypothetical protein